MTDFINFIFDMNLCTMDYQFKPLSDENINKIKQSIDEVVQLHNRKQEFEFEVIADSEKINVNIIPKTIEAFNDMNEFMPNIFKNCIWDNKINGVVKKDD